MLVAMVMVCDFFIAMVCVRAMCVWGVSEVVVGTVVVMVVWGG